ncbi:pyridoxal phosphate-dependent aminotransferase [Candidatus Chloroploca asiatica]|uniref:Aminotransferase n=1 Tax=Candidatus Chloroploca asiatica TaxID=1506545 RepID=A0A2H3KMC0_9CHLR|nr:histidinol-phosphate transaminase [Candidatus Chloroploca asiatica]PDV99225.1 aminotransferase class I/II [Candidatus Chloroploca asiatica]
MGTRKRVVHGALDEHELAALGVSPGNLLDFSSNLNPFGPPAGVRAALAALDPAPYPDRSCVRLRQALAERHACEPEAILPGNGANELIHLVARALLHPGDTVLVIGPTYGEYAYASELMGAHVVAFQTQPERAFQPDGPALSALMHTLRPRLTWLCTPNNPTGVVLASAILQTLLAIAAGDGGYLILDRSYSDLQRTATAALSETSSPHLITLHSLTKSYALAGLRLGYLLASPELSARVGTFQPTWSVSSAAQAAGLAALSDPTFLASTRSPLWAASEMLSTGLAELGLPVWRAALPFVLVRTGDGAATRAALLGRGCVVRDCTSFGLPAWVRVAPRRPDENRRLLAAWKETR